MKKRIFVFIIVILLMCSTIFNYIFYMKAKNIEKENNQLSIIIQALEEEKELVEVGNEILALDTEYSKELDNTQGITSEIIAVNTKYAELWKQEMDKYYMLLLDSLNEENKMKLTDSQQLWEQFSEQNSAVVFSVNSQIYGGGSYLGMLDSYLLYEKYRDRALQLKELYERFELLD